MLIFAIAGAFQARGVARAGRLRRPLLMVSAARLIAPSGATGRGRLAGLAALGWLAGTADLARRRVVASAAVSDGRGRNRSRPETGSPRR